MSKLSVMNIGDFGRDHEGWKGGISRCCDVKCLNIII